MRAKFNPAHLRLSVANLIATAKQEAVVHPYLLVRERARDAVKVLRSVSGIAATAAIKNDVVKALRRLMQPDITPGEMQAITMTIEAINRNELDVDNHIRKLDEARKMYLSGIASARRVKNDDEVNRWQWFHDAIERLDGLTDTVNYKTLWDLSKIGVLHTDKKSA